MIDRKTRVLLIEDNPADARLIRELLSEAGSGWFRLECADTLANGLASVDNVSFDVVVLDLSLPDSDGLATFSALHAHSPQLPVIVLTGRDDDLLAIAALRAGAQDFLVKGQVSGDALARSIRYAIERKRVADALRESSLFTAMLLQTSPLGMDIVDDDGRLLFISPSLESLLGEEAIGKTCWELYKDDRRQCTDCPLKQGIEPGVTKTTETSGVFGEREFEISQTGMIYQGKKALLEVFHDITERKRAEQRSQLANQVLALLNCPVGETDTIHDLLQLVKQSTGLEAVGIRLREGEDFPYHETNGFSDDFLATERTLCAYDATGAILRDDQGKAVLECICGTVLLGRTDPAQPFFTELGSFWTNSTTDLLASTTEKERQGRTRNRCNSAGYESVALIPLRSGPEMIGLLQLNDRRRDRFTAEMIRFFEGLGSSIGIALSRKRAAEALRENESSLQAILRSTADGILAVGEASKVLFANERFAEMWMIPQELVASKDDTALLNSILDQLIDPQGFLQKVQELYNSDEESFDTLYFKDGRVFERLSRPMIQGTQASGRVWSFRDTTERKRAEAALRESEKRVRAIVEGTQALLASVDAIGHFTYVNDATARALGYASPEELIGKPYLHYVHPEDRKQVLDTFINQANARQLSSMQEFRIIDTAGKVKWFSFLSTLEMADGQVVGQSGVAQDITERKRAETALRESEERFRSILDNIEDGYFEVDTAGNFTFVNPALVRVLGRPSNELMGMNNRSYMTPEGGKAVFQTFNRIFRTGIPEQAIDWVVMRPDGALRSVEASVSLIKAADGSIKGFRGTVRDITERKRAEEALQRAEQRYRALFEEAPAMYVVTRDVGGAPAIADCNELACRTLGFSHDELLGRLLADFYSPASRAQMLAGGGYQRAMAGEVVAEERELVTRDGHIVSCLMRAVPQVDAAGHVSGIRAMFVDITERKRAEEALGIRESYLTAILENLPGLVWLKDLDSCFLAVNQAFADSCGKTSPAEVAGKTDLDIWPGELAEHFRANDAKVIQNRVPEIAEEPISDRGQTTWFETFKTPVLDGNGNVIGTTGYSRDITWRKQAEEALRQRLAELEALHRVSAALRTTVSLQEMLDMLLDETLAVLGAEAGGIWLNDAVSNELHPAAVRGWFARIRDRVLSSSEGVAGESFVGDQMIVSREFKTDPRTNATVREQSPEGWGGACVPLQTADQVVGVLFCSVQLPRELGAQDVGLLRTLAAMGGNAIHRARLHEMTERQLIEAEALRQIDRAVASNFDLSVTLGLAVKRATQLLGADAATVVLPNAFELRYAAWDGIRSHDIGKTRMRVTGSCAGRVITERRMITVDDLAEQTAAGALPRFYLDEGFTAYCAAPIMAKGAVKGVLELLNRNRLSTNPHWLDLLTGLCGQAAIAIDNADLFEGLQRSNAELTLAYDATIEGWSRALDLRDKETEGHSQRVTEVTVRLASLMGVTDADLVHVRRGALLHDIGKLGVPDQILLKPGKLTDDEWVIMRRHPQMAYDLLSSIPYLRPALDIPYCHHENWDGTGYPRQLSGQDIPLAARLFAIADVADALGSDRTYRPAWPAKRIQEYLREQSGLQFKPQVVAMFLAMDAV